MYFWVTNLWVGWVNHYLEIKYAIYILSFTAVEGAPNPSSILGLPFGTAGKESAWNVGDLGSISGLGRSAGEGISYPLQYFGASLVAQLVKNMPVMCKTWVWSLSWEDLLDKRKASHWSILAWRIPWAVWSMWLRRVIHDWVTFTFT